MKNNKIIFNKYHDKCIISNYYYNCKIKYFDNKIQSINYIDRNYLIIFNDNEKTYIDVNYDLFKAKKILTASKHICLLKYFAKLNVLLKKSKFAYDIELNYYYYKSKNDNKIKKYTNKFYEMFICCYDKNRNISQELNHKFKIFNIKKLYKQIKEMENILDCEEDDNISNLNGNLLIINSFAFSQLLSLYKKTIWEHRSMIKNSISIFSVPYGYNSYNNMFYDKTGNNLKPINILKAKKYSLVSNNKSFKFYYSKKSNNIKNEMNSGFVITRMYFLNDVIKGQNNNVKALCSGYFIKNYKCHQIFSNKLFSFNIIDLLNNIKIASRQQRVSNEFTCPDIFIKMSQKVKN